MKTEKFIFETDLVLLCQKAKSYPEGILEAHQQLHSKIPFSTERRYFGISRPENGGEIIYRAAAEELNEGEEKKFSCEKIILPKGTYIAVPIADYRKQLQRIGEVFQEILHSQPIDPNGYCVEYYLNETDMLCMVRLNPDA